MQETWVLFLGWEEPLEKKKWQSTPILLPGKSHGQRSLVGLQSMGSQTTCKRQLKQCLTHTPLLMKNNTNFSYAVDGLTIPMQLQHFDLYAIFLGC